MTAAKPDSLFLQTSLLTDAEKRARLKLFLMVELKAGSDELPKAQRDVDSLIYLYGYTETDRDKIMQQLQAEVNLIEACIDHARKT